MWSGIGCAGTDSRLWVGVVALMMGCSDYDVVPDGSVDGLATRLVAEPAVLDLGGVELGSRREGTIALVNHGALPVVLDDLALVGSGAFELLLPSDPVVEPGASVDVRVAYRPDAFEDTSVLEVRFSTEQDADQQLPVPVRGVGLAGALAVEPGALELGSHPEGCVVEAPVALRNVGTAPVELHEAVVAGVGFETVGHPEGTLLAPGASTELWVRYTAADTSDDSGTLWVHHDGIAGTASAPVTGQLQPRAYTEASFLQDGPWDAVDILFAIDGSGSMQDDTARLADNARTFFQALHDLGVDARVAGVTHDDGCTNGPPVSTTEPGAEDAFTRSLDGPWGVHTESLLTVASHALEAADGCNAGLLRPGARTAVVVLSDEPDQSDDSWEHYVARMRAVDPHVVVSAIVGEAPDGCETAYPGFGYLEAASATGGAVLSLCAENWGPFLELQAELVTGAPRTRFALPEPAGPGEAFVTVDGETVSGWSIDRTTHELVFEDWAMPGPGAAIAVEYPRAADCDPAP